ncbi:CDP-glycerol glycerophosphotransferase family protein [Oceanidesulfovibrio marinus]|uniref:CDP-glycerol--poly(Glycerophosphate) glycerophosphotransferase n=1 Tax=Oceanidesulfovibrio marinus TaxID=370038 RepID=A0ABX6NAN5_9BACT|nr:CDP-glycerol glycerophosphotransferase family protein [Oceanidesulfovibrio marinus]QJT07642.1 CDP-glycerol--poly(glycerophosphate) glycerophosphotransferase [Oceanidesulfovibrio marinus]
MAEFDPGTLKALSDISRRTPKKANCVIFMGRIGGALIDNVKYAFLDCVRHFPDLQGFFLTHDQAQRDLLARQNLPVLLFPDTEAVQICARASVVVSDDFWWRSHSPVHALLEEARTFQLWHGIPLKAIGFPEIESSVNMTPEKAEYLRANYSGYDAVLSTSPYFTEHAFGRAFGANDFPELGYPRNDAMLRPPDKYDMLNVDVALYGELRQRRKEGWRVVFYMPTFRDTGGDPFSDGAINPGKLVEFARRNKIIFVCKFHPYVQARIASNDPHVRVCASHTDPYPMLRLADALVTDYSSIYFDYLLLKRPIVYFQYDHEAYVTRNRELMLDMDDVTPGIRTADEEALYAALAKVLDHGDPHEAERDALLARSFTHHDDGAGKRVNQYVLDHLVAMAAQSAVTPQTASITRRTTA